MVAGNEMAASREELSDDAGLNLASAAANALAESISNLSLELNEISRKAIFDILQDSLLNLSQLAEWYSRMPTVSADYALAETYYQKGDYTLADNVLASMLTNSEYDATQLIDYQNYSRIHALKNTLQQDERYWDSLTDSEIDELISIAEASDERSSTMAKGVLCFFYEICYEDELEVASDMGAPRSQMMGTDSQSETSHIQVYPNPVDDNLTLFISELPKGTTTFQLFDAMGRNMISQSITNTHTTINFSKLSQGLYFYRVLNDGVAVGSGKVVKR